MSFEKTPPPKHPTLENGSILTNRKKERMSRLKPGPPSQQHLLGPHRCRYFQPGTEPQEFSPWTNDTANFSYFRPTICHTCMMLSSDTEQMTHGSLGFQEKSEIFAVCPPWIN